MRFSSPSGRAAIELWQTSFDNSWRARVELVTGDRRIVLYQQPRDAWIYFFHVYWSPDESKVALVATGTAMFRIAADVKTGTAIPFEGMQDEVRKSLWRTYRIPRTESDPIAWAARSEGQQEFFRLHPELHLTYH